MKLTLRQTTEIYNQEAQPLLDFNFFKAVNKALQLIEWNFCPKCGFRWERKGNYGCHGCGYLR